MQTTSCLKMPWHGVHGRLASTSLADSSPKSIALTCHHMSNSKRKPGPLGAESPVPISQGDSGLWVPYPASGATWGASQGSANFQTYDDQRSRSSSSSIYFPALSGPYLQDVDDQLDQVHRSLSLRLCSTFFGSDPSQEATLDGGFCHQIHQSIITLHAMLITTVQLNGFLKVVDIINGILLAPSCGYTENVRCSHFSACNDPRPSLFSIAGSGKSVLWFALHQLILPLAELTS